MMKSNTLHKSLTLSTLLLLLLVLGSACVCCQPLNTQKDEPTIVPQSMLLIQNNVKPEDAKNYQITIPKDVKPGEPCLTISWKTNPDGSGPDDPKIYLVDGYFKIMPAPTYKQQ